MSRLKITEESFPPTGETASATETVPEVREPPPLEYGPDIVEPRSGALRKFYFDGGQVEIVAHPVLQDVYSPKYFSYPSIGWARAPGEAFGSGVRSRSRAMHR